RSHKVSALGFTRRRGGDGQRDAYRARRQRRNSSRKIQPLAGASRRDGNGIYGGRRRLRRAGQAGCGGGAARCSDGIHNATECREKLSSGVFVEVIILTFVGSRRR